VDLFFYREPEETKEKEEEEAIVTADYGVADYGAAALPGDQWAAPIPEGQWAAEMPPPPIPAVPGVEWTAPPGECCTPIIQNVHKRPLIAYVIHHCSLSSTRNVEHWLCG